MNFEDDLRRSLLREPAPPNFAAKVLARARRNERPAPFWRTPAILSLAAALVIAALVPPALYEYRRERRGIEARDRLLVALSITRTQLQQAKQRIRETTRHKR
jgi:hypothetical protein